MRTNFLLLLSFILFAPVVRADENVIPDPLPEDVNLYMSQRDLCDHFRGEIAGDPEADKETNRQIKKSCAGADRGLKTLREKYKENSEVMEALKDYDECISADCKD